jgi:integrase
MLIAASPKQDRAVWALAFYAGLRRGELMALRWEDVDLAKGLIRVQRSWDIQEGVIGAKSRAGRRTVPIIGVLRDHLLDHKLRTGRAEGLVVGRSTDRPFEPVSVGERAKKAWRAWRDPDDQDRRLEPLTLHEARHTYASILIAAGLNAKAITAYMGHSSITITYDRYGHLMPGSEDEARAQLDAFMERADTQARLAQIDTSDEQET